MSAEPCNDWRPRGSVTSPTGRLTLLKLILALTLAALVLSGCGTYYVLAN
jgi:hypothetical protein